MLFFDFFGKQNSKNNNFLQVEPLAPFGRVDFGEIKTLLSLEIISDALAKSSRKTMRKRGPPLQNLKTRTQNGRRSRPFLVPFFRVLGGGIPVSHNIFRGICKIIANSRSRQYQTKLEKYSISTPKDKKEQGRPYCRERELAIILQIPRKIL